MEGLIILLVIVAICGVLMGPVGPGQTAHPPSTDGPAGTRAGAPNRRRGPAASAGKN
jgi:hypothetical protein